MVINSFFSYMFSFISPVWVLFHIKKQNISFTKGTHLGKSYQGVCSRLEKIQWVRQVWFSFTERWSFQRILKLLKALCLALYVSSWHVLLFLSSLQQRLQSVGHLDLFSPPSEVIFKMFLQLGFSLCVFRKCGVQLENKLKKKPFNTNTDPYTFL